MKVPKYLQLADELRREIAAGRLRPGDRLPSFLELRRKFGAAQNTAEKMFQLLEQDGLIVREPSRGVFVARPKNGVATDGHFAAHPGARRTNRAKTRNAKVRSGLIGVSGWGFFDHLSARYWIEVMRGIREAAARAGAQILLLDPASRNGWEKADGVLICDWSAHEILEHAAPSQPCVSVLVNLPQMATVAADDQNGGFLAMQHLLQLGHRRIGFLHSSDLSVIPQRLSGCREALLQAGLGASALVPRYLVGDYHDQVEFEVSGRETMRLWLESDWDKLGCTALLCHNDAVALGALKALLSAGKRVPEDVSVVGFDGLPDGPKNAHELTTIEVPLYEIGSRSVDLLLRQIEADAVSNEHHVLPVKLRPGATTAPPRRGARLKTKP